MAAFLYPFIAMIQRGGKKQKRSSKEQALKMFRQREKLTRRSTPFPSTCGSA